MAGLPLGLRPGYPEIRGCQAPAPWDSLVLASPIARNVSLVTAVKVRSSMLTQPERTSASLRGLGGGARIAWGNHPAFLSK